MFPKHTPELFFARATRAGDCLIWAGPKNAKGYGSTSYQGERVLVHRMAYRLVVGEIPPGTEIDHLCHNRACIEPTHLEAVTHQINIVRKRLLTVCKNGHPYTPETTGTKLGKFRRCLICNRANWKRNFKSRSRGLRRRT